MARRLLLVTFLLILLAPRIAAAAEPPVDTDGDGIPDAEEVSIYHTDPLKADTDGDGYPDGLEVANGYDPLKGDAARYEKRIQIDLKGQQLSYYLGPIRLGAFPVSTGKRRTPTPKGTFTIGKKAPRAWSAAAKLWMPWWMSFYAGKYGIHELPYWPSGLREGTGHLGTPVSGGCVRLGIGPAKTLYDWAEVGTKVVIQ